MYQARLDRLADLLNTELLRRQVNPSFPTFRSLLILLTLSSLKGCRSYGESRKHAHAQILQESQADAYAATVINEQGHPSQAADGSGRENAPRQLDIKQRHAGIVRERV